MINRIKKPGMFSPAKLLGISTLTFLGGCQGQMQPSQLPNVVIIYMDDLGYGDLGAYGSTEIKTPHMDRLAHGGARFTTGYSSSATSTPSRYALLTGEYPWREKNAQILPGEAPLIIDTAQASLPKMLQEKGYHTAIVGKWHLGLGNSLSRDTRSIRARNRGINHPITGFPLQLYPRKPFSHQHERHIFA